MESVGDQLVDGAEPGVQAESPVGIGAPVAILRAGRSSFALELQGIVATGMTVCRTQGGLSFDSRRLSLRTTCA